MYSFDLETGLIKKPLVYVEAKIIKTLTHQLKVWLNKLMEFEKPPIERERERPIILFSEESLINLSMRVYLDLIHEAQDLLKTIQEVGFWSPQQAKSYAEKYPRLKSALEVERANSLLRAIIEDRGDAVLYYYPPEATNLMGDIENLKSAQQLAESISKLVGEAPSLDISCCEVYEGFYRLTVGKTKESGLSYKFSINIDSKEKTLAFLAFQPVSELIVGFSEEIESNEFIRKLFKLNPRTNIQVSEQVRRIVAAREQRLLQAQEREQILRKEYEPEELPGWETTDPEKHNPNKFRYIVHAVTDEVRATQLALARARMMLGGEEMEEIQEGSAFDDPETFLNRRFISASVIDEVHRGTWSAAGVILRVPRGNILLADSKDIGSIPNERLIQKTISGGGGEREVPDAWQILKKTDPTSYNEVIVSGSNPDTGEVSEIIGVFIIIDTRTGKPKREELAQKARDFAAKRSIPIIEIPEPVRI